MDAPDSFLDRLNPEDRAELQRRSEVRHFKRGHTIIAHGDDQGREVFFLLDGRARVTVYSESGKAVAYRVIEAGGIFGELSAIDGRPRSANVVALDDVFAGVLQPVPFKEISLLRPGFSWSLLQHFASEMRRMTERVYEFSTLVVQQRLVRELLRLVSTEEPLQSQALINSLPTHSDLAAAISTHREEVSRAMSALMRANLIERRGRTLVLLDIPNLKELCGDEF